jgi:pentatricopeptide repeat protein
LIKAWRDVVLATDPSSPASAEAAATTTTTLMGSDEMMARMLVYLEANLWEWSPHAVMWILDVTKSEMASSCNDWEKVPAMVAQLTINYAADRPLDVHLTTRLLQSWAASGRPDAPEQAMALVEHLKASATVLDAHVYAALVHVWAKSGRADAGIQAMHLLWQGQQQGASFSTPVMVYNSVIHALCKSATLDNDEPLVQAHSLLEELLSLSKDLKPDTATYTPLLKAYLYRQDWRAAVDLWRRMSKRPEERLRPHWAAHKVMRKALERHKRHGGGGDDTMDDAESAFHELPVDWQVVAEEWKGIMTICREKPTPTSLANALEYLDDLSLASAFGKYAPHWKIPVKDMDFLIDLWRRTGRRKVTLRSMLWRARKYQGIELLHPGNRVLDWMMEALGQVSETPTAAARAAESLLNLAVEDCQYDVHHRDFVNKLPVTRLIRLWAVTPEAPEAAEVVWGHLQEWYVQSGERSNLRPDDLVYGALVRAWDRAEPSEKAHRAWQLWQERLETQPDSPPGIMLYQVVANTLAQAGRVSKTEQLVAQVIRSYIDGDKRLRPNEKLIAALVMAHCRAGQPREALKALAAMEARFGETGDRAYQPNVQCYNILLNAFAEQGDLDEVQAVLTRMLELAAAEPNRNIHPDIVTWNSYLKSLIKNKSDTPHAAARAKAVLRKLQEMRRRFDEAPAPDVVTYHCVLKCYSASLDPLKYVEDAEDLVKDMEVDPRTSMPDAETYFLLFKLLHKAGGLGDKALLHLEHFCRLAQEGKVVALPEVRHFNTVVSSYLLSGDATRLPKVFSILQLMRGLADQTGWKVRPNRETFRCIIDHCRQSNADPKVAEDALKMMEAQWMDGDRTVKPDSTIR